MKRNLYLLLSLVLLFISCDSESKKIEEETKIEEKQDKQMFVSGIGATLSPEATEKVASWSDYYAMSDKVKQYYKINIGAALMSAHEVAEVIKRTKDTIDIPFLDQPEIKVRFNVMYNTALRLEDMAEIPSIKDDEVKEEIDNLLEAYSSLNDKINSLYKIQKYQQIIDTKYKDYNSDTIMVIDTL